MYEIKKIIKDKEWTFVLLSDKKYEKDHGVDSYAITRVLERTIYFRKSEVLLTYIIHELFHAFIASSLIASSTLSVEQHEELCCEIISNHYFDIGKLAFEIHEFFHHKKKKVLTVES